MGGFIIWISWQSWEEVQQVILLSSSPLLFTMIMIINWLGHFKSTTLLTKLIDWLLNDTTVYYLFTILLLICKMHYFQQADVVEWDYSCSW